MFTPLPPSLSPCCYLNMLRIGIDFCIFSFLYLQYSSLRYLPGSPPQCSQISAQILPLGGSLKSLLQHHSSKVTHRQTMLSLLGLLYPSTVVLQHICMICPCLLIGWSSLKAKTLLFTSLCPQPGIYKAHSRCSINGCRIEIGSWFPCSIQGEPKLVALRRGGDWLTPWQLWANTMKVLSVTSSFPRVKQRAVHRVWQRKQKHEFSSLPPFFFFFILFQTLQMKELTICSLGHWNKMER